MAEPRTHDEAYQKQINELSKRINAIADQEAREARRGGGPAARGELMPEKLRLLGEIEALLDKLEAQYAPRT